MRLDHLLSREKAQRGTGELIPRSIRSQRDRQNKKRRTASPDQLLIQIARKILYRLQGPAGRTLTTAQQRSKDSIKGQLQVHRKMYGKRKQLVSGSSDEKIKLQRAQGGCPGTIRRRRTWQAAISCVEPQAGIDTQISEWGNPAGEEPVTVR